MPFSQVKWTRETTFSTHQAKPDLAYCRRLTNIPLNLFLASGPFHNLITAHMTWCKKKEKGGKRKWNVNNRPAKSPALDGCLPHFRVFTPWPTYISKSPAVLKFPHIFKNVPHCTVFLTKMNFSLSSPLFTHALFYFLFYFLRIISGTLRANRGDAIVNRPCQNF